jgi:hypothetical protein
MSPEHQRNETPEAPAAAPLPIPVTPERIEEMVSNSLRVAELTAVSDALDNEITMLGKTVMLLHLADPALEPAEPAAALHRYLAIRHKRIEILKRLRLELEADSTLLAIPNPPKGAKKGMPVKPNKKRKR